jgi:hypothetical protein
MSKQNIILFCENNHYDALTHAAEEAVIHKLDKQKWTHSLVESDQFLTGDFTAKDTIDLYASHFNKQSTSEICFVNPAPLKHKFNNNFISHDFDVKQELRDSFFNEVDLCPKLDKLHKSIIDSEFYGIFSENFYKDRPFDIERNEIIVKNLENLSYQLGNNYTIGWAGRIHCVDYHHYLLENNSSLLERTLFLNINTPCSVANLEGKDFLSTIIGTYFFANCNEDSRVYDSVKRIPPYEKLFTEANSPQGKIQNDWEKEFIKSPHVLNLNLSITDEPGAILPWQVADLDIFN